MPDLSSINVLALNVGSSSLKFSLFAFQGDEEKLMLSGKATRLGLDHGRFQLANGDGQTLIEQTTGRTDHSGALNLVVQQLSLHAPGPIPVVGHRVVQGGPKHAGPERVTPKLIDELRQLIPLDPPHLPAALAGLAAMQRLYPEVIQVACFDTSFHRTLPAWAQQLPLPAHLTMDPTFVRYGFHGLSYEHLLSEVRRQWGDCTADGKIIMAHLGNGASMAALHQGRSVETTMGFSPASGLIMGSRTGDLDPGALIYLLNQGKVTVDGLSDLIYQHSGLEGISGYSSDMQDLLHDSASNPRAALAVEMFAYQARRHLGALVAVLDGLDLLIFSGGIGEHGARPRSLICQGLRHLGVILDETANAANAALISAPASAIPVRIIPSNEELAIARHARRFYRPAFPPANNP